MKDGDMIRIDYEIWLKDTDELYQTSKEDVAKENDIFDEKGVYKPVALVVGQESVLTGLNKHLLEAEKDKDYEIEITPEDGFGERDPKLVELRPLREFTRKEIEPYPGLEVTIGNKVAWISQVFGGRVRVDFNHRLAGRTIAYKYKIVEVADSLEDKARFLIDMNYGLSEAFELVIEEDGITVTLPDVCKYDEKWFLAKYRIVTDLRAQLELGRITFLEEYSQKKDEAESAGTEGEEAPAEEAEAPDAAEPADEDKEEGGEEHGSKEANEG